MIDFGKVKESFIKDSNVKLDWMMSEFAKFRTGRATPSLLDNVKVENYGTLVPLKKIASVQVADARQLIVKAYDKSNVADIVNAINKAKLNVNPVADGDSVRIVFSSPTQDSRKVMAKSAKEIVEQCKVQVRNLRQDYLKKFKADKTIQEDDIKYVEEQMNKLIKDINSKIDQTFTSKEKEIMTV
jgi:ribosome recycling factor